MRSIVGVILILFGLCEIALAGDAARFGFNEPFAMQYGIGLGLSCVDCPTNAVARNKSQISTAIKNLVGDNGIKNFREIIPLSFFEPTAMGDTQNYAAIDEVMKLYRDQDATLVLTTGRSFPPWMSTSSWCPMPSKDEDWRRLRESIASVFARYLTHLKSEPKSALWMERRLYIEGMNEFDDLLGPDCKSHDLATPSRAAELELAIQRHLAEAEIRVSYVMPSIAGVYSGYPGASTTELFSQYLRDYYKSNGIGLPNIHLYFVPPQPPSEQVKAVKNTLVALAAAVPENFRKSIAITEIGASESTAKCSGGTSMSLIDRNDYYARLLSDSQVRAQTSFVLLWRLSDLKSDQEVPACEKTHGVMTEDLIDFKKGTESFLKLM